MVNTKKNWVKDVVIYSNIFSFSISILIYDYVLLHASEQGALDYTDCYQQ